MTQFFQSIRGLAKATQGVAAIEVALVSPLIVLLALGSFEVSNLIARHGELQGAMAEASSIALASEPTTQARRDTLKAIIQTSTGLPASKVIVDAAYRCGAQTALQTSTSSCGAAKISSYVKIELRDTYTPIWTDFGVGSPVSSSVTRNIMIKQQVD